jgi:DNA-binding GntR family transcriptional regulator
MTEPLEATAALEGAKPGLEGLSVRVHRVAAPVREQVLEQLREAIIEMRLQPEQRLVERELIEQTGVSRTTIREVLRQLASEGLVTTIPNKGVVVAAPSLERAAELYEVRAVLEGMAAREFAERASDDQLRKLRETLDQIQASVDDGSPGPAIIAAKKRFYDVLFEGAANQTIQEIVQGLQARVTVLRRASLAQPGRARQAVEEVREIVEALEARDGERAAAACVHHVTEAARTVFEAMAVARELDQTEAGVKS